MWLHGDQLYVFYSVINDKPERIYYERVDLGPDDWLQWKSAGQPTELLRPELEWEGANLSKSAGRARQIWTWNRGRNVFLLALEHSKAGPQVKGHNMLTDPCIFEDDDHSLYLLYSGGGEKAIGIARLDVRCAQEANAQLPK